MTMTEKYKIIAKYIKDMSSETPDIETFIFVQDNITKYNLSIDITSQALKNKFIQINITLKFEDKEPNERKSHFEMIFATVIKLEEEIKEKKELEKIILCDVPQKIYPDLERIFLNLLHNSGHPEIKFEKKIDFEKLYQQKFN
jgi:preprotein translocase subunit SecB